MMASRSTLADRVLRREVIDIFASSTRRAEPIATGISPRISLQGRVRCVLFDLYGTLFISASGDVGSSVSDSEVGCFAEALRRSGIELLTDSAAAETRMRYFHEIKKRHAEAHELGIEFPEVDIADVWRAVLMGLVDEKLLRLSDHSRAAAPKTTVPDTTVVQMAAWYEHLSNPVSPMPGARSAVLTLKASGMPLGIVSNSQFYTPLLFPALFGDEPHELGFEPDYCSWSYRIGHAKPSGRLFEPILERLKERLDIPPKDVLYVGNDMLNDVWAAHDVGCRTALFAGDRRSLRMRRDDPRCLGLEPDLVVVTFSDLLMSMHVQPNNGRRGITG